MARRYDRFPTGKGQAPGIVTGLGVCGARGSAAGWAVRASGAGRLLRVAGFFLAAFFLADFLVGFFLAVFFAAVSRAPPAALRFLLPAALPALRAGAFRADLRAALPVARRAAAFFLAPPVFFPTLPVFFFAGFLRPALLAFAMPCSFVHAAPVSEGQPDPCSRHPDKARPGRARDHLPR